MRLFTLVFTLSLVFIIGSLQAQEFRFPSKVRVEGNRSYTYEALEAQQKRADNPRTIVNISDEEYKSRVESISGEIPMKFNALVKSHVKAYVTRRRSSTEKVVGRSMVYFPIFEETFRRHNMPTDLKYLAIVESTLNPRAVSPVGATGLWQFMKPTGKQYGLRITGQVDERRDPHAATDAAARYLSDLYSRYGDWNLAIASYNCGPGRTNGAVKKAGKSDYWAASRFLPKETRNYVPAFIGVAYAMNYYHLHNIYPEHPEYDLQIIDKIRVFDKVTFNEISQITGITVEAIRFMNPALNQNYVPKNSKGHIVSLPLTVMAEFRAAIQNTAPVVFGSSSLITYEEKTTSPYVSSQNVAKSPTPKTSYSNSATSIYRVKRGDNLAKIAKRYHCSVNDLKKWNNIKGSLLQVGQQLVLQDNGRAEDIYTAPKTVNTPSASVATKSTTTSTSRASSIANTKSKTLHKVKRGETLWGIAAKNKVKVQDILNANNMTANEKIEPGMQLVIPTH